MTQTMTHTPTTARLRTWQLLMVGLMVLGYSGFYLCRSNFSVTISLIIDDLVVRGIDRDSAKVWLGWVTTLGTLGYALGKFLAGGLVNRLGGRQNYLISMAGAVACTMLFAMGGSLPVFTLAWVANRLIQSVGWPGMIKITSRWFSYSRYGTVMGIISLSFLFGDAVAHAFMGRLISAGMGWRGVFWVAAGVLAGIWILNAVWIRESPKDLGLPEPPTNPGNLFGTLGEDPNPDAAGPLFATMARSPAFWIVCFMSVGMTLLRETFNTWTPTYLVEGVGLSQGSGAGLSSLFPLFGGISVIAAGILGDRFGRGGRAAVILVGMTLCGLALIVLGTADFSGRSRHGPDPALPGGIPADRTVFLPGRRDLARPGRQARRRDRLRDHRRPRLPGRRAGRRGDREDLRREGLAGRLLGVGGRCRADERGGWVLPGRPAPPGALDETGFVRGQLGPGNC